ncbi:uncharacterized protein LOC113793197 [Dermatophagoides pteronyssinus]|uniref:Uncharacterized protein LOC113793197 n=2 Tax=Dermatophagoides pteronyssinus TaxID=6956 RepID=A0A6P6Y0K4_DERPT|nr:uncharacterized protein LOC113793197 [Dermatophagoides pteronyssinus]KAH9423124.1 hypothetical protein DERP_007718 [Dermatophagoides pteronyssinus]
MDWCSRFPYLVPVWHSLSSQNLNLTENQIDPNLCIEFGGIGTYDDMYLKQYKQLPYRIDRPTLPFFIDSDNHSYSKLSAYNCLAFCSKLNTLFSSKHGKINVLTLKKTVNESNDGHRFTVERSSSVSPFVYDIDNIWAEQVTNDNILNLRLYENGDQIELLTHSRQSLALFNYRSAYEIEERLSLITNRFKSSRFFPSSDSLLNVLDRSSDFHQEILTTFIDNPIIYRSDIEKQTMFEENMINVEINQPRNHFIHLEYMKNFNPFLYLYGTHQNIWLGDTRIKISGEKKQSKPIINSKDFPFFKPFELFHTFRVNPVDPHQFITTSDFNINFFDLRYPKKNLFQIKHMISDKLVNRLLATKLPSNQSNDTLMLMASNHIKTCLLTFNSDNIQPKMLHVPFYLDNPNSINKLYPFISEYQSFIRGMEILPESSTENSGRLSIAFLMNNGDIFFQDFWPKSSDDIDSDLTEDFMYENTIDNKTYLNTELDSITKEYMNEVLEYLNDKELKIPKILNNSNLEENCQECMSKLPCTVDRGNFCQCLRSEAKPDELELFASTTESFNEILSTENSTVALDGKLCYRDSDQIDFESIKQNWFHLQSDPTKNGLRQFCRPLTQKLFDPWYEGIIDKSSSSTTVSSSSSQQTSSLLPHDEHFDDD